MVGCSDSPTTDISSRFTPTMITNANKANQKKKRCVPPASFFSAASLFSFFFL